MSFSQELADTVCARIAEGRSLRSVCSDEGMPTLPTFLRWVNERPALAEQYAHARANGLDALAEETLQIADDGSNDWMERHAKDSVGYELNGEHVQRSKLRVDTRKWLLSKLAPKKYGDKLELAGDKDNPLTVVVQRLTDEAKK